MKNIIDRINEFDAIFKSKKPKGILSLVSLLNNEVTRAYGYAQLGKHFEPYLFRLFYFLGAFDFGHIPGPILFTNESGETAKGYSAWEGCFPIWEAAKYLESTGMEGNFKSNPMLLNLSEILVELVERYLSFRSENINRDDWNITTDYYFCQVIFLLPIKDGQNKFLDFIFREGLQRDKSTISADLTDKYFDKVLRRKKTETVFYLLEKFFVPQQEDGDYKIASAIDSYYLDGLVKRRVGELYDIFGADIIDWAITKLRDASEHYAYYFLKMNIVSLEVDTQNNFLNGVNFSLVNFVFALLNLADENLAVLYGEQLNKEHAPILRRLSFYLIDKHYKTSLKNLFWTNGNILNDYETKLEVFRIINRHCKEFDSEQTKQLFIWINEVQIERIESDSDETYKKHSAYKRLEWMIALEPIFVKYNYLIPYFNELKTATGDNVPEHPGYDSYFQIRPGGDYSATNRITTFSTEKILNLLANEREWAGYDTYGLQQDLLAYVANNYDRVIANLDDFVYLPPRFIYHFLDGLNSLVQKNFTIDLPRITEFLPKLLERSGEWEKSIKQKEITSIYGMISWFIKSACQQEDNKLTIGTLEKLISILISMDFKDHAEFKMVNADPAFDVINSSRGKIYDTLITCSLRAIKLSKGKVFWHELVKGHFTIRLSDGTFYPEFYWSLGFSLPNISYLDVEWLTNFKEMIFETPPPELAKAVFSGYLIRTNVLYSVLFKLLRPCYEKYSSIFDGTNTPHQRLIDHITIAYLLSLEGSQAMIETVLARQDVIQLRYLVKSLKTHGEIMNDGKLIKIWEHLLASEPVDYEQRSILTDTLQFVKIIKTINEEAHNLFIKTAGFCDINSKIFDIIQMLCEKINEENFRYCGRMVLALLANKQLNLGFENDTVVVVLKSIYEYGDKELADQIAIATVERKNFNAVTVYNEHHEIN